MTGKIQYFIDDCGQNFLEVEFEALEDWSAGEGDTWAIDILGIALNGTMSQKIGSVKVNQPDWWAGIHERITNYIAQWEQAPMLAA